MPYGHSHDHPLRAFLGDLDVLDWAIERVRALRGNDSSLEDLARECDEMFSRMNPRPDIDPLQAAQQLLEFSTLNADDWQAFWRYTYAQISDSPSNHGPS